MLIIRLRRSGKKHEPHYRFVVQEKRSKLNGKYIESLGSFHPLLKENQVILDKDKAKDWLKKGISCSETVTNIFVKEGLLGKEKKISKVYSKKSNRKEAAKEKPEPAEKPAEDQKSEEKTETPPEEPTEKEKEDEGENLEEKTEDKEKASEKSPTPPENKESEKEKSE